MVCCEGGGREVGVCYQGWRSPKTGLLVRNWRFRPMVTRAEEGFRARGGIFLTQPPGAKACIITINATVL